MKIDLTYHYSQLRCQAETLGETRKTKIRQGKPTKCMNHSTFKINGLVVCVRHAETIALRHCLKENKLEQRIPETKGQIIPVELEFERIERVLHDLGTPYPPVTRHWLRQFYECMTETSKGTR